MASSERKPRLMDHGAIGHRLAALGLGPLLLAQGIRVRATIPRLVEPPGPRAGVAGQGAELRLLILGDSAAAGVGAAHQTEALTGRLVERLSQAVRVNWTLLARTGATTDSTLSRLRRMPIGTFDLAVTSLGVNDAIAGTSLEGWRQKQQELRSILRDSFGVRQILVSGLPPVSHFPALPQPLRWFLGSRCRRFDEVLARDVADDPAAEYLRLDFLTDVTEMAEDGFHPGPGIYDRWAAEVAAFFLGELVPGMGSESGGSPMRQPESAEFK